MNSAVLNYQLPTFTGLMNHGHDVTFLHDQETPEESRVRLDAEVRSGDYFITLATSLDLLSQNITNRYIRASLDTIVADLVYLQNNYSVHKDDRTE
jgi:hypothetical protein